jgi:hypothetical protein
MSMTVEEVGNRVAINDMLSRYGTVIDNRDWNGLDAIFDDGIVFDMTDISRGVITGLEPLKSYMDTDAVHPAAHIITNIYVESLTADAARMSSRLLAIQADGSVIVGEYKDSAALTDAGWRITHRVFTYTRRVRSSL